MDPRYLFNEVTFSHAGQDNNIYVFLAPKLKNVDDENNQYFLQNSQKNAIISSMVNLCALNMELIPQDPIYEAFTLGLPTPNETLSPSIGDNTFLVIKKSSNTRNDVDTIKNNVNTIFQRYFSPENNTLGQLITLNELVSQILSVDGVSTFYMMRTLPDGSVITNNGLTMLAFNPNYSDLDIVYVTANLQLPYFKFPFLYNKTILNKIIVQ